VDTVEISSWLKIVHEFNRDILWYLGYMFENPHFLAGGAHVLQMPPEIQRMAPKCTKFREPLDL
jgi:hypothetical protein